MKIYLNVYLTTAVILISFFAGTLFAISPVSIHGIPTVEESVEDVINECYHDRYSTNATELGGAANICNHIMDMLNRVCNQTDDKIFSKCDSKLLNQYIQDENLDYKKSRTVK